MTSITAVFLQKAHDLAELPTYETKGAAGADVRSVESFTLFPGERRLVSTGLKCEIPEGVEIQVRPRSGLAYKHGVTVLNAPGTIDSDYRGILGVLLINLGDEPFQVNAGDRIAQIVVARAEQAGFFLSNGLSQSERGEGGFGHTGVK